VIDIEELLHVWTAQDANTRRQCAVHIVYRCNGVSLLDEADAAALDMTDLDTGTEGERRSVEVEEQKLSCCSFSRSLHLASRYIAPSKFKFCLLAALLPARLLHFHTRSNMAPQAPPPEADAPVEEAGPSAPPPNKVVYCAVCCECSDI
jgi:hypothetical protein